MTRHPAQDKGAPALAVRLRGGIGRLIDSCAEGVISKAEFEPWLAGLRRRVTKLEAEATTLQDAAEQARSLQLVIGKLELFAALVRDRLNEADPDTTRDIGRTLVRRVEIGEHHVRVVFRVDPGLRGGSGSRRIAQYGPARPRLVAVGHDRGGAKRRRPASRGVSDEITHRVGEQHTVSATAG